MAAQVKEGIMHPDPLDPQHLGPHTREGLLDRIAWRDIAILRRGIRRARCRQGAAVQLADRR
ncbi:MAG TPA: hypothetical protein VIG50_19430, partial [Vicinamibacteria bacterium]